MRWCCFLVAALLGCGGETQPELPAPPHRSPDFLARRLDGARVQIPANRDKIHEPIRTIPLSALEPQLDTVSEDIETVRSRDAKLLPPAQPEAPSAPDTPENVAQSVDGERITLQVTKTSKRALRLSSKVEPGKILRFRLQAEVTGKVPPSRGVYVDIIERSREGEIISRWVSTPLPGSGSIDRWWRTSSVTDKVTMRVAYWNRSAWSHQAPFGLMPGQIKIEGGLELHSETADPELHPILGPARLDDEVREGLYAPAGTTFAWRVHVPRGGAVLDTAAATFHDDDVQFRVLVDGAVKTTVKSAKKWTPVQIRLSRAGESVIRLETIGRSGACAAWASPIVTTPKAHPRRIVVVDMDTASMFHTSFGEGGAQVTPWLVKLAAKGALFRNAYSTNTWTLPSHIDIFSGAHKPREGTLPTGTSFVGALRDAGFLTAGFTAGGYMDPGYGFADGFDMYRSSGDHGEHVGMAEYLDDTLAFLRANQHRDVFLFIHGYDVHAPYNPPASVRGLFDTGWRDTRDPPLDRVGNIQHNKAGLSPDELRYLASLYRGQMRVIDDRLSQWRAAAGALLDEATLLVISDHGEAFGERDRVGHAHEPYRETTWVPLIAVGPGFQAGRVDEDPRSTIDIAPTILTSAGLSTDGLPGIALQKASTRDRIVAALGGPFLAIRDRTRSILLHRTEPTRTYDRAADPGEMTDLGAEHFPDLTKRGASLVEQIRPPGFRGAPGTTPQLVPEAVERLRALGYTQ